ncbi:hypothetical protein UFOVP1339_24 [uncultured Caudovirales phage]|uniref:Uncharacterized protein n=1 Tax=uncultured Caudovirales phage TaxID=2100421 RepID=A0A6J5RRT5_9CAUD|nr:hypothetical protein UFOVP1339_24 [uncultured Caudovirales phage]
MTQIAIKYVNHPKNPSGKMGSVKDVNGDVWWMKKELVQLFTPGTTVDVPVSVETWGKGSDERQVNVITAGPSGNQQSNQQQQRQPDPDPRYQGEEQSTRQETPTRGSNHMSNIVGADLKDRMIFATAVTGRAMGSGKFDTKDVGLLLQSALAAFDAHLAAA